MGRGREIGGRGGGGGERETYRQKETDIKVDRQTDR